MSVICLETFKDRTLVLLFARFYRPRRLVELSVSSLRTESSEWSDGPPPTCERHPIAWSLVSRR